MQQDMAAVNQRVDLLTKRVSDLESDSFEFEKTILEMSLDLKYMKASQESLNNNLSKFLWIVGGGFLAAVVSFVVKGGLL